MIFQDVRKTTEVLCAPLGPEDFVIQAMPDASPPKWHLAHTTWFFEQFILKKFSSNYEAFDLRYDFIFNSYYETVGPFFERPRRGLLSRPTYEEIFAYRRYVDEQIEALLATRTS